MKHKILPFLLFVSLVACNNNTETEGEKKEEITSPESAEIKPQRSCYEYVVGKDSVRLKLTINDKDVNGKLDYNMYEKDSRHGNIQGVLDGDIIKADYVYQAEGTTTRQQLWLKLENDKVYEGTGDIKDENNAFVYADTTNIKYTQAFEKIDCKED